MLTKNELSNRRSQLSPAHRALLEQQLRGKALIKNNPIHTEIPKRPPNATIPLSFAQERLFFLQNIDPLNPAFNEYRVISLHGALNVPAFNQMARALYRRHEILRTRFQFIDGQVCQVVDQDFPLRATVPVIDLSDLPEDVREAEAQRLVQRESRRPFDLSCGPMFRLILVKLREQYHLLLQNMHHIVYDGWSNEVLLHDIMALYQAFDEGRPSPLPELSIQYGDFALWQRQWLEGQVFAAQIEYWRAQFQTPPPVLDLLTDRPRPAVQQFRSASEPICISGELTQALQAISQREGATLFMTLLMAFKVLLFSYTGQVDLTVGTYIAGRSKPELEQLIGFFVNSLPLRTDLSGDPSFAALLQRVRTVTLGAYNHQDVPFEKLIALFQPQHDMSRTPLYQSMFILQNTPKPTEVGRLGRLSTRQEAFAEDSLSAAAQCDITLILDDVLPGLQGWLVYDANLFYPTTIQRMLAHFQVLLERISANVHQRLSDVSLLMDVERQCILREWNATAEVFAETVCVQQLFEAQVAQFPDVVALVCEDEHVSYQELNRRADRVAQFLRMRGVGPDVCVGLCIERSVSMVIGLWGVLKSGGAYVPLDPAYPVERLHFVVRDTRMVCVLTRQGLVGRFATQDVQPICLDSDWSLMEGVCFEGAPLVGDPANLAYVLYTSGSTGTPKGVAVQHRSLVQFAQSSGVAYEVRPGDRALQFASISFDTSAEEVYPALLYGATLVLRTEAMLRSPMVFLQMCWAWGITLLNVPTAYWHSLREVTRGPASVWSPGIRVLIIGGERALPDHWAAWRGFLGGRCRLVNTYGPTEATVVATRYDEGQVAEVSLSQGGVPIGCAISNMCVYVLDGAMNLAPVGVPGELYIGGVGLARGYMGRADLTAERFVPNPFGPLVNRAGVGQRWADRLYRTGDRGRYLPSGCIEFLGRNDDQVKVRGFRIELGEVERVLCALPGVRAGVVVARADEGGTTQLVAYVVPMDGVQLQVGQVQQGVRDRLPEYMVPAAMVVMSAFPLTPSGKVDRRALVGQAIKPEVPTTLYVAPSTPIEDELVLIWGDVLRRPQIGVNDSFFELGGHSLLVTQVVYRINDAFAVDLPLRSLFEERTIANLALRVEEALLDAVEQFADEVV